MTTVRLVMPEISASQASKEITHNEALRMIDALMQGVVKDRTLTAPPGSPVEGDVHIPLATATGAWVGQENTLAHYYNATWYFYTMPTNFTIWSIEDAAVIQWSGSAWNVVINKSGKLYKTVTGNTTLTGIEESNSIIEVADGGGLAADFNLTVSTIEKVWHAYNATNYVMTVKTSGGSGQAVDPGRRAVIYGDGTNVVSAHTAATDGMVFRNTIGLPQYSVSSAPAAAAANNGHLIWVSDGDAGAKCLAASDGTNWKRIALGATISAT